MSASIDGVFQCPFCPCLFFSQYDLDCHLKAFGRKDHLAVWRCSHILIEEHGYNAGVDEHGDWFKRRKGFVDGKVIKNCRVLVRTERSDVST